MSVPHPATMHGTVFMISNSNRSPLWNHKSLKICFHRMETFLGSRHNGRWSVWGKRGKLTNSSHYWSQVWGLKHLKLFIGVVQGQPFLAKPHSGDFHSYYIIKSVEAAAALCFWHWFLKHAVKEAGTEQGLSSLFSLFLFSIFFHGFGIVR